jgi:5'-3' exonuclease
MYYQEKFNFDIEEEKGQKELNLLISNYIEGLQWNLFYFKGL